MSTHQTVGRSASGWQAAPRPARDPNHGLNVRVLRFRRSPDREDPSLLAQELLAQHRHEDALELLEVALAREPGDADLELLRGRALLGAGQVSRAKETLIRAAKAAPEWAAPLTWLTRALSLGGDAPRAGAVALRAKSLGADDTQVVRLAKGHEMSARLDARLARYRASPANEEPVMLARELALSGRSEEATGLLRVALEQDPEDADILAAVAQIERSEGRTEHAIALWRRARSAAPGWDTVERALHSLVGAEVLADEPRRGATTERERAVSVLDLDISVEPMIERPAVSASDVDEALDALLGARRDETVPYSVEARDTEHGGPAIDATVVGIPAAAREPIPAVRPDLAHGRIRRAGASGWPRRVVAKTEASPSPYVRVLVGDARARTARA